MKLILFLIIIGVKSLITKAAALGLLFLIFLMKDRALCFAPSRWIWFIFGLSKKQIKTYAAFLTPHRHCCRRFLCGMPCHLQDSGTHPPLQSLYFSPGLLHAAFNFINCGIVISWMNGTSIIRQKEVRHRSTASLPFFLPWQFPPSVQPKVLQ